MKTKAAKNQNGVIMGTQNLIAPGIPTTLIPPGPMFPTSHLSALIERVGELSRRLTALELKVSELLPQPPTPKGKKK